MSKQTREERYLLNDYITREKTIISINKVEYEVTRYQGDHSNEYLLSEMKDGKVEGRCQLFNRGILSLAWTMKNGKRIGEMTEYKHGKALQKENWDSILKNDGDRRMIENSKEGLIMVIRCKCGNGKENDNDDIVIYRGGFDEEMNRDGYGIEYDMENDGKEKIEGYWSKDKLIRMIREFDADNNQMIEYAENNDENGNAELLNRIPIYVGEYSIENGKYVRNGLGYLIDEASGTAIRESEWEHDKEKEGGIDLYEGWYTKGMSESIRSVLINNKEHNGMGNHLIITQNMNGISRITKDIEDLVISSNCCNDLVTIDFNEYVKLKSIRIENCCFESVQTFHIDGLNRLKSLMIGTNSFSHILKGKWNSAVAYNQSKSFHILNCESLESIQIGEFSFSDFAGDFELKNLPQLQSIQIGTIGCNSRNFYYSSFVVRGITNDIQDIIIRSSKSTIH